MPLPEEVVTTGLNTPEDLEGTGGYEDIFYV
jgi:hypothetical protein